MPQNIINLLLLSHTRKKKKKKKKKKKLPQLFPEQQQLHCSSSSSYVQKFLPNGIVTSFLKTQSWDLFGFWLLAHLLFVHILLQIGKNLQKINSLKVHCKWRRILWALSYQVVLHVGFFSWSRINHGTIQDQLCAARAWTIGEYLEGILTFCFHRMIFALLREDFQKLFFVSNSSRRNVFIVRLILQCKDMGVEVFLLLSTSAGNKHLLVT